MEAPQKLQLTPTKVDRVQPSACLQNRKLRLEPELIVWIRFLDFAWTRVLWKHGFDCFGGFDATLLLHFINPIRDSLNHFARGLRLGVSLGRRLLFTRPLMLFDYSYCLLF
jgi:hypothetical protein